MNIGFALCGSFCTYSAIFPVMEGYFHHFLQAVAGENEKAECLLPVLVDALVQGKRLQVAVLQSEDRWFGMTYQAERMEVAEKLRKLHAEGVYPPTLQ